MRARRFGDGRDFLTTWQAWTTDPARPGLLHFVTREDSPVSAHELLRAARGDESVLPLARELAAQWWGLVPGVHRLSFESGRVLLTLCVGGAADAAGQLDFVADAVVDGEAASGATSPIAWDGPPGSALVVGAGLAGAAAAASLARRGWRVQVLDQAAEPAAGASGLPAGLLAPHTSSDDNLLSQLSRAGVRITWEEARRLLQAGQDWEGGGVREWRQERRALPDLGPHAAPWQQVDADGASVWHGIGAWVRPAALVRAWLGTPGVTWTGRQRVHALARSEGGWQATDDQGHVLARADLAVVAAALGSGPLVPGILPLHAVRGQVSLGPAAALVNAPGRPVNGNGHFLPRVPLPGGPAWLSGSSYVRGDHGEDLRPQEHLANFERLQSLCPDIAAQLAPAFASGTVQSWAGIRCASADRRPLVGPVASGLWVSTAMGSRGLTFAALAAELLAARLHGEPLPVPARLARALDVQRAWRATGGPAAP